jgi:TatD DNase family protein
LPSIIDTHAHLDELENIEAALQNAEKAGIQAILAVGAADLSNRKILEISKMYPSIVFPALGLHPWSLGELEDNGIKDIIAYIEDNISHIAAIGEIGLDYNKRVIKVAPKERQKEVMRKLLLLAHKYDKPVSVHSRYAWKDCFQLVFEANIKKAVFHWFTGFSSVLEQILESGYFISATPAAEYHEEHRRAIKHTPLDQLLLETDCPVIYGREVRYTSQPSDVLRSLKAAAEIKNTDPEVIAARTTANAVTLFHLK